MSSTRTFLFWGASLLFVYCRLAFAVDSPPIINDVYVHTADVCTPPQAFSPGVEKFVEIYNRSSETINTTNWWLCDQPAEIYRRLLQEPTIQSGPPLSDGILLQP